MTLSCDSDSNIDRAAEDENVNINTSTTKQQ